MPDNNQTTQPSTTDPLDTSNPTPTVSDPVAPIIPPAPVIPEVPETKTETPTEPLPSFINMDSSVPTPPPAITEETSSPFKPVVEEQTSMPEETPPIIQDGSSAPSFDIPPVITPPEKPKAKLGGKVIATILGILLLVGGIGTGLYLVGQQQDLNKRAVDHCAGVTCDHGYYCNDIGTTYQCVHIGTGELQGGTTGGTNGSSYCNVKYNKDLGCGTNNCKPTEQAQEWTKVDCGTAVRCIPDSRCGFTECTPGEKRCTGDNSQACGTNNRWGISDACKNGCNTSTGSCKTTGGAPLDLPPTVSSCVTGTISCIPDHTGKACNEAGEMCQKYHVGEMGYSCSACSNQDGLQISGVCDGQFYCISSKGDGHCIKEGVCNWGSQLALENYVDEECAPDTTGTCKGTTPLTPITPPTDTPICQNIKAYDTSWNALTADQLKTLKVGDVVKLTVKGTNGTFDKAQFKINGAATWTERTDKKPSTEEFFIDYTIPAGITTFNVEAQVHVTGGVWK
jgi:hypothetical protein